MGAPDTAYFNNGNTISEQHSVAVATRDVRFPIFTAAYPTPAAFKQKFYCDYLLEYMVKKDALGNIQTAMVAAVIEGTENAKMHAANRFSNLEPWVKLPDGSVVKVIILNDGGLHTLGYPGFIGINTPMVAGNLKYNYLLTSAHYDLSSAHGVEINVNGLGWVEHSLGSLAAATSISGVADFPALSVGDEVYARLFIVNPEGKKVGQNIELFYVRPEKYYIHDLKYTEQPVNEVVVSIKLGDAALNPAKFETDIDVTVRIHYTTIDGSSFYEFVVTILAGDTHGEVVLVKGIDFGTSSATIDDLVYISHLPVKSPDNIDINRHVPVVLKWWVGLVRVPEDVGYQYQATLYDNDKTTPSPATEDITVHIRQYFREDVGQPMQYIDFYTIIFDGASASEFDFTYMVPGVSYGSDPDTVVTEHCEIIGFSPTLTNGRLLEKI